jgi:hypothetical protein
MVLETISRELSKEDLAWLAGIMDGEGWFSILNHSQAAQDKHGFYTKKIRVGVGNTDVRMIANISRIWKALGIVFHYQLHKVKKGYTILTIETDGKRNAIRAIEPILSYLVNKHEQASICLAYAKYRLDRGQPRGDHGRLISTLSAEDEMFMAQLKEAKRIKIDPSETKRKASEILMI